LGMTTFEFTNVAKAPFFSKTKNLKTTCEEWTSTTTAQGDSVAPWLDLVTDQSFNQFPIQSLSDWTCAEITELADNWE